MRGFSVFAPLLGTVMLATAIAFAVTVTAYEVQRSAQIRDLAAEIHVKTLPDVFKWDALSTFAVALRNWFYTTYVYSPGYTPFSGGAKEDLVDAILAFLGANPSDPDTLWARMGVLQYRYYVKVDSVQESALKSSLSVEHLLSPEGIYVKVTPTDVSEMPDFILDTEEGSKINTIKTKLFGKEGFGIPVYYPATSIEAAISQTKTELQGKQAIGGFIGSAETKVRVGAVEEKRWRVNQPFDEGRALITPCTEYYVNWRRDESIGNVYVEGIKDKIREILESIGWKNPAIYVTEKETDKGMEYKRLVCIDKTLGKILFGEERTFCKEVDDPELKDVDGDRVFYTIVKKANIDATWTGISQCAPGGSVNARAKLTLDFDYHKLQFHYASLTHENIPSGYVCSSEKSGCSGEVCDEGSAKEKAKDECISKCKTNSGGILGNECEYLCKGVSKDTCCKKSISGSCLVNCHSYQYCYSKKAFAQEILKKVKDGCISKCKERGNDLEKCKNLCKYINTTGEWLKINCGDTILAITTVHYSNGNWDLDAKCVDATSFVKTGTASECATCEGVTYYYNGSKYVWGEPPKTEWGLCNDRHDNDCDGKVDADDPDCQSPCCPVGTLSGTCTKEDDIEGYQRLAGHFRCDRLCTCGVCTGKAQLTSYIGICKGDRCVSEPEGTTTCSKCVSKSFIAYSKKDAICLTQSWLDPEKHVIAMECSAGDNDEKKCCCWIPKHTYRLGGEYKIYHMVVMWKTGTNWNCKSDVHIQLYDDGKLVFEKTFPAAGHFAYRKEFDVPEVKANTVVITDYGKCYIDYSHILVEVGNP